MIDFTFCKRKVEALCHQRDMYVLLAFLLSAPMVFVRNLHFYSNISLISCLSIIFLSGAIALWSGKHIMTIGVAEFNPPDLNISPKVLCVYIFALEGIGLAIPIKNAMIEQKYFNGLFLVVTYFVTFIYSGYSIFAALVIFTVNVGFR